MTNSAQINRWTGKFASRGMETEYQNAILETNRRHNILAISIALPLYSVYFLLDRVMLQDPDWATTYRLITVVTCGALLASMHIPKIGRHHETITSLIVLLLGYLITLIIWHEPTLNNDYYVGLIQGGVFISFLLRISFFKLIATLVLDILFFAVAVLSKQQADDAVLEIFVLLTMFVLCGFGFYLFERYRRTQFAQAHTIARQNEQLAAMLADAQLDNERKLAALNTLIHFVKTPIHQIVGFTDLIVKALSDAPGPNATTQLEHAEFVKKASADLSSNVAKLLAYYRLDEQVKGAKPERVELSSMLDDFRDLLDGAVDCRIESRPPDIYNYAEPVRVALTSLASLPPSDESAITTMSIKWRENAHGGIDLIFISDGQSLTEERFADLTQPLTKITNYLTAEGLAMPMTLRTVARAADICGGRLSYRREEDQNVLTLSLKNLSKEARREAAA